MIFTQGNELARSKDRVDRESLVAQLPYCGVSNEDVQVQIPTTQTIDL